MSRVAPYAELHQSLNGPGDGRPAALRIIKDEGIEGRWAGRVVLITGCSPGGIGPETARAIHATGADVYITGRDEKKAAQVAQDILSDGKPGKVEVIKLDLGSLESVREGVEDFVRRSGRLNILINNAGIMATPASTTADGFESQIGTNHLGHFLLFQLLKQTLLASSTPEFNSRVVSVSSGGHRLGKIDFEDLNFEKREYDPWLAYGQSKLANVLFANGVEHRYGSKGLHGLSVHPGIIGATKLQQHLVDGDHFKEALAQAIKIQKSSEQGAATSVWAATAKILEGKGGIYLEDVSEAPPAPTPDPFSGGYSDEAFDLQTETKLWVESEKLTVSLNEN